MSTTMPEVDQVTDDFDPEDYYRYRSVSALAVTALVVGFISLLGMLTVVFVPVALGGIFLGLWAARSVRKNRDTQTGAPLAYIGTTLCLVSFIAGGGWYVYDEFINLPEGYEVIGFKALQPTVDQPAYQPVPDSALELDGRTVLIRGYVYPHAQSRGLTRFVMVPDFDTCCFGGQPKLTDMVEVTLTGGKTIDFSFNRRKIGGVFKVHRGLKQIEDLTGVFYELEADYVD
ncbi:MAG: DUF3299 domain-containing protein [Pirellulaceae bacterium]